MGHTVDPLSVSALVAVLSKISSTVGEEAGRQLWQSLSAVVRRVFQRRSKAQEALDAFVDQPGDPAKTKELAEALAAEAQRNPTVEAELRRWLRTADRTLGHDSSVHNTISGTVHGTVIQSRDIEGDIRLG
jgi:hypothetical protein